MTLAKLVEALRDGRTSALAVVERSLVRIATEDPELHAFAHVASNEACRRAARLDAEGHRGRALFGVPFAVKSNFAWSGQISDCGSLSLRDWSANYTATAVQRLIDAGAIPIGGTRMDEFGMGSSGEHSCHGPTRNPWDTARIPGGSSSGSAAAVAARLVPFALGSDTGGSIRQPAALCGIAGAKPTFGRVSRYGLVAYASALDCVGALAPNVEDLQLINRVLCGPDPADALTFGARAFIPRERSFVGLRIGVPGAFLGPGVESGVRAVIEAAQATCAERGAEVVPVQLDGLELALSTYYVLACSQASSNLARISGVHFGPREEEQRSYQAAVRRTRTRGFGAEVERRILLGTFVLSSAAYDSWVGRAERARAQLGRAFGKVFDDVDLLLGPTSPTVAFPLGERVADPVAMVQADTLTVPVSLAGLPAISVPGGLCPTTGLPVGLQWIGPPGADEHVHAAARAFESTRATSIPQRAQAYENEGWA